MKHIFSKKNRALLVELVKTDFKLRYQNSVLGYLWSLLRPLLLFLILYVVFVKLLKIGNRVPHYPVYLLVGIVVWNFFLEMTSQSVASIVARGDLIRKIKIPRWLIPLSISFSAVINLLLNLIVIAIFVILNHVDIMRSSIWIPIILVEVYIFSLGVAMFLAAAFVKYRDISYIWEVATNALFYLTPILYPISLITNKTFQKLMLLNPMAQTIQDARYSLVTHQSLTIRQVFNGGWYALIPLFVVGLTMIIGAFYFRKESKYFAENI